MSRRPAEDDPPGGSHIVVCGSGNLAYRVVSELVERYRARVTVVVGMTGGRTAELKRLTVRVVEADPLNVDALLAADLPHATAIGLLDSDDVGNIRAALVASELNPAARVVLRSATIGAGTDIRSLLDNGTLLSDVAQAAPAFVSAALGEPPSNAIRVPGRTLRVERRGDVRPEDALCGITTDPVRLVAPADPDAELVVALAAGEGGAAAPRPVAGPSWPRRLARRLHRMPGRVGRALRVALAAVVVLYVAGTAGIVALAGLGWLAAAVQALLFTIGESTVQLGQGGWAEAVRAVLAVLGVTAAPLLAAAIIEAVINARLGVALGRTAPAEGHVVVVGLGVLGGQIVRQLYDLGLPVVGIDRSEQAAGVATARRLGVGVIIGDATAAETVRAASVDRARALVAVTTDDVTNLQAALHGRAGDAALRVVLRLEDSDFAGRIGRSFGLAVSRSDALLAAPAFAAALLQETVLATVPVGRRVVLVAELTVQEGSTLDGALLSAADEPDEVRVIAFTAATDLTAATAFAPQRDRRLVPGDRLLAVCTRAGLGRLRGRIIDPLR